jgi:hypothetical protein
MGMSGIVESLRAGCGPATILGLAQELGIGAQGKLNQQGSQGATVAVTKDTPVPFRDSHHHPTVRSLDFIGHLVMGQLLVDERGAVRGTQRGLDSGHGVVSNHGDSEAEQRRPWVAESVDLGAVTVQGV